MHLLQLDVVIMVESVIPDLYRQSEIKYYCVIQSSNMRAYAFASVITRRRASDKRVWNAL